MKAEIVMVMQNKEAFLLRLKGVDTQDREVIGLIEDYEASNPKKWKLDARLLGRVSPETDENEAIVDIMFKNPMFTSKS